MYYNIATLESAGVVLDLNKKGNKYVIVISHDDNYFEDLVSVDFNDRESAYKKYLEMTEMLINGLGSFATKVKKLKGEN